METLTRRGFLASTGAAAVTARIAPVVGVKGRPILTLVYDKSMGMMRAVEKIVFR